MSTHHFGHVTDSNFSASSPRTRTPYLRCTAYDLALTSTSSVKRKPSHPHERFYTVTTLHRGYTFEDRYAHYRSLVVKEDHDCVECREILTTSAHTWQLITAMNAQFKDDMFLTTLQRRMLCYPAGGLAHAALTVEVALENEINATEDELDEIMNAIAWLKDPAEKEASTLNDGYKTAHSSSRRANGSMCTLHLPVLIHHHYDTHLENVSRNEQRLCGVSAVKFLLVLGITDTPEYCLATDDEYAYLSACWYSSRLLVRIHHYHMYY